MCYVTKFDVSVFRGGNISYIFKLFSDQIRLNLPRLHVEICMTVVI